MALEIQFREIRNIINQAKIKAFRLINLELINLYWEIGKSISEKIEQGTWGKSIVNNLADYLKKSEPELKGFSSQNLWRMKQFYQTYYKNAKLSPLVREITWTNNLTILSKSKTDEERKI